MASGPGKVARLGPSARKVYLLVRDALERNVPLQAALSETLLSLKLSEEVRRQATDLVYTAVRSEVRCLYVLHRIYPKFGHFPKVVQRLLVAACAALLFQEKAPAYAIVHETVADISFLCGKGMGAAANWGLRSLLRLEGAPLEESFYKDKRDRDDFSAFLRLASVPEKMGRLFLRELGEENARAALLQSFTRPVASLRLNPLKEGFEDLFAALCEKGWQALPGRAGQKGLFCAGGQLLETTELVREGRASLQAAGSQLILASPDFEKDVPLWDMCAGFGGKTCALLEEGIEVRLASDTSFRRLRGLPGECERLGLAAPLVFQADGTRPPFTSWQGDILLDVPCTGLGVLSRRPDIKLKDVDIEGHTAIQKKLLARALALVQQGRQVIYMTCTVTRSENEQLVRDVLSENHAELVGEWRTMGQWEGMYAACLRKL